MEKINFMTANGRTLEIEYEWWKSISNFSLRMRCEPEHAFALKREEVQRRRRCSGFDSHNCCLKWYLEIMFWPVRRVCAFLFSSVNCILSMAHSSKLKLNANKECKIYEIKTLNSMRDRWHWRSKYIRIAVARPWSCLAAARSSIAHSAHHHFP